MKILVLAALIAYCSPAKAKDAFTLSVAPESNSYVEYQPIGIRVRVVNNSKRMIRIAGDTKSTWKSFQTAINFSDAKLKIKALPRSTNIEVDNRIIPSKDIPPGEQWQHVIFLQSFAHSPAPGQYTIPYNYSFPFISSETDESLPENQHPRIKGELQFTVLPRDAKVIDSFLNKQMKNIHSHNDRYEIFSEGLEGILACTDPLAVPRLVQLLDEKIAAEALVKALAKFKEDGNARAAVVRHIRSSHSGIAAMAIYVVTDWKYVLSITDIKFLLASKNAIIRNATIDYIKKIKIKEHLDLIPKQSQG